MKKWTVPIIIILIFVLIIGILMIKGLPNFIEYYKQNKEQSKMQKAFILDADFPNNQKEIKDFQVGKSYSVILYEDGTVWVAGSNYYYNDGYIYGLQRDAFTKVNIENIEKISVGSNFVLALSKNGEVYSWGGNDYGQLGREAYSIDDTPKKLELKNIKEIYTKDDQAAALSHDNVAYYWGYATRSDYSSYDDILKIEDKKITDIFLIGYKFFFKTEEGKILGLGFDFEAMTDEVNGWATKPVELDISNVKYIREKGTSEAFVIKEDGTAYTLNANKSKELTKIETAIKIKDIYFFDWYSQEEQKYFIIDENNNLYYNNECILKDVESITHAKMTNSSERILILKKDGTVYNFGYLVDKLTITEGGYSDYFSTTPIKLNVQNIKLMGITEDYVILIDKNNTIYRLGKSEKGGLGTGEDEISQDFGFDNTIDNSTTITNNNMNQNYNNMTNNANAVNKNQKIYDESNYQQGIESGEPYYYQLDNGETILIDPAMSTMAD